MLAADVRLDAVARDGLVVAGQPLAIDLLASNRGKTAMRDSRRRTVSPRRRGVRARDTLAPADRAIATRP
jgi:hypothetical protein